MTKSARRVVEILGNKALILQNLIEHHQKIVFFGGAGVSTESGIPDFRSADGLFNQELKTKVTPEEIVSHSFLKKHPQLFFDYYFKHLIYPSAKPNPAHAYLAALEQQDKSVTVITQNIDGLHQVAGSQKVLELHGSVQHNHCELCQKKYSLNELMRDENGIPRCDADNGIVRPDVVLYREALEDVVIDQSIQAIKEADLLIIAGTSLSVYPSSGLIDFYQGEDLVLINKSSLFAESQATLVIHQAVGELFQQLN